MGYTRSWTPATRVISKDLPSWKLIMGDIHQSFLSAGLVQSSAAGQLDIASVAAFGADNTYAGFCEYLFTDALQAVAPVSITVYYGFGIEGLNSTASAVTSGTPRCKVEVRFKGSEAFTVYIPQSYVTTSTSATQRITSAGSSFITYNPVEGFFGLVYGAGSRGGAQTVGSLDAASFALFVERVENGSGIVSGNALRCYAPDITMVPSPSNQIYSQNLALSGYLDGMLFTAKGFASDIALQNAVAPAYSVVDHVYCPSPDVSAFRNLYLGHRDVFTQGVQFDLNAGAVTKKMISVGAKVGAIPTVKSDQNEARSSAVTLSSLLSLLMLYE